MATFTGQLISATYDAILKTIDNDAIGASAKQITDGLGNSTPLYISSTQIGIGITPTEALHVSGNAIITGSITIDTNATVLGTISGVLADGVTATTQTAGDNSTKVATTAYVSTALQSQDTLEEVLAIGNTTGGTNIAVSVGDNITFGSTSKAIYFNSLEIYATGNDAYLKSLNGSLSLINNDNGTEKTVIKVNSNTAELYNNNVKKLETTPTGINVIGDATFAENDKALFGNNGDLEIYRDANDSRIVDEDSIIIKSQHIAFQAGTSTETIAHFYGDSSVELYYDGVKKFSTTSAGIDVIGDAVFNGNINLDNDERIRLGTSNAFQIYYDSSAQSGQGEATITSNFIKLESSFFNLGSSSKKAIAVDANNYVRLYHNDSLKLSTISTGVDITGAINADSATFAGNVAINGGVVTLGIADTSSGHINAYENMTFNIDIDNDDTTRYFGFYKNGSDGSGTELLKIEESGNATFAGAITAASALFNGATETRGNIRTTFSSDNSYYSLFSNDGALNLDTYGVGGNIQFKILGTTKFTIANSGNATFAGNVTALGNVGIGVTPVSTVLLDLKEPDAGSDLVIGLTAGTGARAQIRSEAQSNDTKAELGFYTVTGSSTSEAMRINQYGNVGIGTDSPYTNLEVANSGVDSIIRLYAAGGTANIRTWEMRAVGVAGEGLLFRQANDANNSYSNRMILDNDGNVGIGTISPVTKLHLYDNTATVGLSIQADNAGSSDINLGDEDDINIGRIKYDHSDNSMQFQTNNAERMRITSGGDVAIGGTLGADSQFRVELKPAGTILAGLRIGYGGTSQNYYDADEHFFRNGVGSNSSPVFIDSNQNLLVGGTTLPAAASGAYVALRGGDNNCIETRRIGTGGRSHHIFYNANGIVGSIQTSGSSTSYNTSSDYRLKEDLQDFNGLDKVSKIPVYDYKWKSNESRSYGVMAHELQEVLPDAVTGEKDAEEMQGVDYSKIVPLLVKSIQELKAEVDKLKQECKCK